MSPVMVMPPIIGRIMIRTGNAVSDAPGNGESEMATDCEGAARVHERRVVLPRTFVHEVMELERDFQLLVSAAVLDSFQGIRV